MELLQRLVDRISMVTAVLLTAALLCSSEVSTSKVLAQKIAWQKFRSEICYRLMSSHVWKHYMHVHITVYV